MDIRQFFKSFTYAIQGMKYLYQHEQNIRIQTAVAMIVLLCGYFFQLSRTEWVVILLLIAFVLVLEIVNSVIERFIDIVKPRFHSHVQVIKDMLAAMVFFAAVSASIIGIIIFWPHISSIVLP